MRAQGQTGAEGELLVGCERGAVLVFSLPETTSPASSATLPSALEEDCDEASMEGSKADILREVEGLNRK